MNKWSKWSPTYCYRIGSGALYGIHPIRVASDPHLRHPRLIGRLNTIFSAGVCKSSAGMHTQQEQKRSSKRKKSGEACLVWMLHFNPILSIDWDGDDGDAEYIPDRFNVDVSIPGRAEWWWNRGGKGRETLRTCLRLILALLQYTFYRCVLRTTTMYHRVPESVQLEIQSGELYWETRGNTQRYKTQNACNPSLPPK